MRAIAWEDVKGQGTRGSLGSSASPVQGGGRLLPTHPCLEGPLGCESSGFIPALAPAERQNPGRVAARLGSTS